MKYVLLIHSDIAFWESLPKEETDRVIGNHFKLMDELRASGELIRVDGLAHDRTFVEFRDGAPAVTDGPFGEVKEQLAGVFVVDVDSLDRAREVAGPISEYGVVEIPRSWRTPGSITAAPPDRRLLRRGSRQRRSTVGHRQSRFGSGRWLDRQL